MLKRVSIFLIAITFIVVDLSIAEQSSKGNIPQDIFYKKEKLRFIISTELSRLEFSGKSTLHKFHGMTDEISGFIQGSPAHMDEAECEISFRVTSLHTEIKQLNKNMWEDMDAEDYPLVTYRLKNVEVVSLDPEEGKGSVIVTGDLNLHNITRSIKFPLEITYDNGFLRFRGYYRLNMKDYHIKPRSFLFVIKVDNYIDITIDVYAQIET